MYYDWTYILLVPALLFTIVAQAKVSSAYKKYSQVENGNRITGTQAARAIMDANGLADVPIETIAGELTDNYDPRNRTMHLSAGVAEGTSIASIAIAAHESGHAIQHGTGYALLRIRNAIAVPISLISHLAWPLIIIGILVIAAGRNTEGNLIFNIGIVAFLGVVLFHLITLPVELDASRRAIQQMQACGLVAADEVRPARKVLSAAAMTYLAALAVAVMNLIRILIVARGRN